MFLKCRLMSSAQWRLYFALELLDHVQMMPSWEAVAWANFVARTAASEEQPEIAARLCAALYVGPLTT
ncbi:hypothetical protein [Roseateles aquatilis]|jgi:hypothetical protein|nr:hypothetical protein [Roseateles aquatilis]